MNARAHARGSQSAPPAGWLAAVDRDLVALTRGASALRLALGDGLALLRRTGGAADLGFPDLGAFWAYELTRRFVAAQTGASSDDAVIEVLLAESLVSLQLRHPGLKRELAASARAATSDQQRDLMRRSAEVAAEDRFHGGDAEPALVAAVADAVATATDGVAAPAREPVALDAHLRDLNTQLQRRDGRLGELARRLWEVDGWHDLGYASPTQYAHERLGCSLASVKARMTLDRRCDLLPEVALALDEGAVGFEAARLVSGVADHDTVGAWLDRAGQRTVKHLKEEVEAVETIARAEGASPFGLAPPDDKTLAGHLDLERAILDGTVADLLVHGGQMSGDGGSQSTPGFGTPPGSSQMSGDPESAVEMTTRQVGTRRGAGRVALRLWLGAEMVAFWCAVEGWFRAAGEPGEFADFLIRTFWHEWLVQDPSARVAYQDVHERERFRFRCAPPVCSNRDLTPHHLVFRSRGGGEERSNLVGLCVTCHLELLHQGRLRAAPPAEDVRWTLSRGGLITVLGRTRN
ncbi:MAG: hypothetical protein CVU56_16625 [Deltaproteobacteria bacterium HGW-Deltaproteobacteria-14]|jgi:hypothetical protein|nr:MAG: hypothetical protein CVU56_16625 [Deltaproteobacteria bacterium HGW-Deltaproteobacteria-14]